jgi:hypothetical protein
MRYLISFILLAACGPTPGIPGATDATGQDTTGGSSSTTQTGAPTTSGSSTGLTLSTTSASSEAPASTTDGLPLGCFADECGESMPCGPNLACKEHPITGVMVCATSPCKAGGPCDGSTGECGEPQQGECFIDESNHGWCFPCVGLGCFMTECGDGIPCAEGLSCETHPVTSAKTCVALCDTPGTSGCGCGDAEGPTFCQGTDSSFSWCFPGEPSDVCFGDVCEVGCGPELLCAVHPDKTGVALCVATCFDGACAGVGGLDGCGEPAESECLPVPVGGVVVPVCFPKTGCFADACDAAHPCGCSGDPVCAFFCTPGPGCSGAGDAACSPLDAAPECLPSIVDGVEHSVCFPGLE